MSALSKRTPWAQIMGLLKGILTSFNILCSHLSFTYVSKLADNMNFPKKNYRPGSAESILPFASWNPKELLKLISTSIMSDH